MLSGVTMQLVLFPFAFLRVYKKDVCSDGLTNIGVRLTFTMFSRLPLLLVLALFISLEPYVDALRYDLLADAAVNVRERSLQQVTNSRIVLLFDVVDNSPAGSRFKKEIGHDFARKVLEDATAFALEMLDQIPFRRGFLGVTLTVERSVMCDIVCIPLGVSSTNGSSIFLNSAYLERFKGDVKSEFRGIIYHETANVWQWNGGGKAPKWLLSGIADYARLKSGQPSKHWPKEGSGLRWTEGNAVTAYFLQYCSHLHEGFIAELNSKMSTSYSDEYFVELLGKSVSELWNDYKHAHATGTAPAPAHGSVLHVP